MDREDIECGALFSGALELAYRTGVLASVRLRTSAGDTFREAVVLTEMYASRCGALNETKSVSRVKRTLAKQAREARKRASHG